MNKRNKKRVLSGGKPVCPSCPGRMMTRKKSITEEIKRFYCRGCRTTLIVVIVR